MILNLFHLYPFLIRTIKLYSPNLFATTGTKMQWQLLTIKGHPDYLEYALTILLSIMFEIETLY